MGSRPGDERVEKLGQVPMFLLHWGAWGAWAASLLSVPWTELSETPEPRVGRLSWEKWPTRAGACKAQATCLLDLVLLRPGSTLSLSFLMSCDLAQHIRRRPVGEDWMGGGGKGTEPCLLTPPSSNRSLHVCVWVSTQDLTKSWAQSPAPRGAAKVEPLEPQRGAQPRSPRLLDPGRGASPAMGWPHVRCEPAVPASAQLDTLSQRRANRLQHWTTTNHDAAPRQGPLLGQTGTHCGDSLWGLNVGSWVTGSTHQTVKRTLASDT